MDIGRDVVGVAVGVTLGVEDPLSAREVLEPDLGVMFEFNGVLAGEAAAPFGVEVSTRPVAGVFLPRSGDEAGELVNRGATYGPALASGGAVALDTGCLRGACLGLSRAISDEVKLAVTLGLSGDATRLACRREKSNDSLLMRELQRVESLPKRTADRHDKQVLVGVGTQ